jgi:hypothetical protein
MAISDVLQLNYYFTIPAPQTAIVTAFFRVIGETAPVPSQLDILTNWPAGFGATCRAVIYNGAQFYARGLRKIRPVPLTLETFSFLEAGAGTAGTDPMPSQVAGVISRKSGFAGRRYRGRVYVPFPSEQDNDAFGRPTANYQSRLAAFAQLLPGITTINVGGGQIQLQGTVVSRKFNLDTPILTTVARQFWGTQRRRGDFGRTNPPPV